MKRVLDGKAQWRLSGKLSKEGQGIWVRLFLRNIQSRHRGPDIFRGGLSSPRPAQMLILEGRLMQDGEGRVGVGGGDRGGGRVGLGWCLRWCGREGENANGKPMTQ